MMDRGHAIGSSQLRLGSPILCLGQTSWKVSQCSFKQGLKKAPIIKLTKFEVSRIDLLGEVSIINFTS